MSKTTAQRVEVIGLPLNPAVSNEAINNLLSKKDSLRLVSFVAPNSWALAKRHPEYREALQHMTFNMAGSSEVAWACRLLTGNHCTGVNFRSNCMSKSFFQTVIAKDMSIMLAGGKPGIDEGAHDKLQAQYPDLKIISTIHGYGEFGPKITEILEKSPDVILVDMPTPRQEAFLLSLSRAGYRGMAISTQGYFEELIAEAAFCPPWVERWNFYFIWRFYREPPHSWTLHLNDYGFFVIQMAKAFAMKCGSRLRRQS